MKTRLRFIARITAGGLLVIVVALLVLFSAPSTLIALAQQPTGSIPTVTGTPEGPMVKVYADQNIIGVYAGPSAYLYPQIGLLLAGEEAPALGFSADLEWIQIIYLGVPGGTGWIYAPFVTITEASSLPVLPNPPTATPRTTPTIDPTQAALYGVQLTPARLPTFTQPAPLEVPEFDVVSETRSGLPMGLIILVLALLGVLGAVISFVRGR
ncbi:MAG: hypothetical protein HY781_11890 [Chloroflexi bacterium]|nr:hypothetical protein [Chloroflexota bacterium]